MLSSLDIEKKIRALYTIEDIVGAMKAYAGVTMRRTDDLVQNIRAYEKNLLFAMADIISHYPGISLKEHAFKVIRCMEEIGVDVSEAVSTLVTEERVRGNDFVIAMVEEENLPMYLKYYPKLRLWDIEDAVHKDDETHARIRDELRQRAEQLAQEFTN